MSLTLLFFVYASFRASPPDRTTYYYSLSCVSPLGILAPAQGRGRTPYVFAGETTSGSASKTVERSISS